MAIQRREPPSAAAGKPLLHSWRKDRATQGGARTFLFFRRAVATTALVSLVALFAFQLFGGMWRPRTHFLFLGSNSPTPGPLPPIEFSFEDFAGFTPLEPGLTRLDTDGPALAFDTTPSVAKLRERLDKLAEADVADTSTVVLYVAAHGVVVEGKPFLVCGDFSGIDANRTGLLPVDELLKKVAQAPGAAKLLLLDASRADYAPSLGLTVSRFEPELAAAVKALGDPRLWVLSAVSPIERSHVSHGMARSVFGYTVATGMQGAADTNSDGDVLLAELRDFTRHNTRRWVEQASAGEATQTPTLYGPNDEGAEDVFVIHTRGVSEPKAVAEVMATAGDPESQQSVLTTALEGVKEFVSEQIEELPIDRASRLYNSVVGGPTGDPASADDKPMSGDVPSSVTPTTPAELAQKERELVLQAWRLTDEVQAKLRPSEWAPHVWNAHLERLAWLDHRQEAGWSARQDRVRVVRKLGAIERGLADLLKGEPPERSGELDLADPIVQLAKRRDLLPFRAVPAVKSVRSLALGEALDEVGHKELRDDALAEFVAGYDAWLDSTAGVDVLDQLREKHLDAKWEQTHFELRLIAPLLACEGLDVASVRLALSARRRGERLAVDPLWGQGWAKELVGQGDRLRREAERLVGSRAVNDWAPTADTGWREAIRRYDDAQKQLAVVRDARGAHDNALLHARDYLRLLHAGGFLRDKETRFDDLLSTLGRLEALLDDPSSDVFQVQLLADEVARVRSDLELNLAPAALAGPAEASPQEGDPWRLDLLLRTGLLSLDDRERCSAARKAAERELLASFKHESPDGRNGPDGSGDDDDRVARAAKSLEREYALLTRFSVAESGRRKEPLAVEAGETRLERLAASSESLGEQLRSIASDASVVAVQNATLDDVKDRPARIRSLRRAARSLCVETGVAVSGPNRKDPFEALERAAWYDVLVAASQRKHDEIADSPADEVAALQADRDALRDLANLAPGQPTAVSPPPPALAIEVSPPAINLEASEEGVVALTVRSQPDSDLPVWIVSQFDERAINVDANVGVTTLRSLLADKPTSRVLSGEYPYKPEAWGVAPSFTLGAGQSRTVRLKLSRVPGASGDRSLVIGVATGPEYLRAEVELNLPGDDALRLDVDPIDRLPSDPTEGVYPLYPNHRHEFALRVAAPVGAATGPEPVKASASLWAFDSDAEVPVLEGSISRGAADLVVTALRARLLANADSIELPSDGSPAPLSFQFADAGPAKGDKPPQPTPFSSGLLLNVSDGERVWLRRLAFEVPRPRTFLEARGEYQPGAESLRVTVSAKNADALPEGGVKVELSLPPRSLSQDGVRELVKSLSPKSSTIDLVAPLLDGRVEALRAVVHVDGYPRAFTFEVPVSAARQELPPKEDLNELRFVKPSEGAEFKAGEPIRAKLEIDAPRGGFGNDADRVEVGLDVTGKRALTPDDVVDTFRFDRRVEVACAGAKRGGSFAVISRTADFEFEVSSDGVNAGQSNLVARGIVAGEPKLAYRPIVIDGAGPTIGRREIDDQEPGKVIVRVYPEENITDVKLVEAMFDGVPDSQWAPGKSIGGGAWVVELKTDELPAGSRTVLIRATDGVGNVGEKVRESVTIAAAGKAAPPARPQASNPQAAPRPVRNRVSGRVTYGSNAVSNATVELTGGAKGKQSATIGDGGAFDFGEVEPGEYQLVARGLAGGNYHSANLDVRVPERASSPVVLDVKIR
ncbi:MAG: hypothetical protein ACRCT8_03870 [Lacipirellulaceae bacterium]